MRHPNRVRRAIGYVAQDSGVDWEATGRENLLLQGRIHGMAGAPLRSRVDELLELVGLREAADRVARGYSGGMKRRLDIALGLVHQPRVLFLDEPTTGLDPEARAAMWVEVERLAAQESLTILLTTHYLEEADRLAERVAIVSRGKIVVEGTPEELKANLRGELVTVELGGANGRLDRRRRDRARDRRRGRGRRRRTPRAYARPERRAGDPGDPRRAREPGFEVDVGDDGAPVARRRLPPLHGPRLRDRGRGPERMMQLLRQTGWMVVRQLRNLMREPIWIALMVIQPMIWLLLYGQLFSRVSALRGRRDELHRVPDARDHLHERLLRRQLVRHGDDHRPRPARGRPLPRHAGVARRDHPLAGRARGHHGDDPGAHPAPRSASRSASRVHGGALGWLVVFVAAAARMAFAGFSNGIALLVRKPASMIAAANFVGLPLMFLSAILIPQRQMPNWIQQISRFNPVNWGVHAARNSVVTGGHWGASGVYLLFLLAACAVTSLFATWCFRAYQRSI